MMFLWLPYLRVTWQHGGAHSLRIGRAEVLDDDEDVWVNQMGRPRPEFLRMFRWLPRTLADKEPELVYGTLIRSDEPEWLRDCMEELAAVLFWLADSSMRSFAAEAFTCRGLNALDSAGDGDKRLTFHSKYSMNMESSDRGGP